MFAKRMQMIPPASTIVMAARVAALRAEGRSVINLAQGEPDFDTPPHICAAAAEAMAAGLTRYTAIEGAAYLHEAIRRKFVRDQGVEFSSKEIIVSAGAKQVIFNAFMATLEQDDEVVIPAPYWVSFPGMAAMFGARAVIVECDATAGFKLRAEQLARAITPKTKWLVLNSPCNPSGAVYSADELRALADVLLKNPNVMVLSDDVYESIRYGAPFTNCAMIEPSLRARVLTVNAVSKSYCMTGWRIGYGAGPEKLIAAMTLIQSQSTANASSISQAAAAAALDGSQSFIADHNVEFRTRRDLVVAGLNQAPGISCSVPQGAFYVYPSCAGVIGSVAPGGSRIASDRDFVNYLLESECLATVHGAAFGLSPHFRISYATSREVLKEACTRIIRACEKLKR